MHREALQFVSGVVRQLPPRRAVVELGSRNVNGSVRPLFHAAELYLGVDLEPGAGVDVVADAADFASPAPVDTVVTTSTLEHTPRGPEIVANAFRMLEPGGVLIVTTHADPWPPHSAVDGGELFEGEYYGNLTVDELRGWLQEAGFGAVDVQDDGRGNLFAVGARPADVTAASGSGRRSRFRDGPGAVLQTGQAENTPEEVTPMTTKEETKAGAETKPDEAKEEKPARAAKRDLTPATCGTCGRSVYASDLDKDGNCSLCEGGENGTEANPDTHPK